MKNNKYAKFYAILKQVNANGLALTKEQAVYDFTGGYTTSLSSLSADQLAAIEVMLSSMISQRRLSPLSFGEGRGEVGDKQRKAIIAIFKSIGRTTEAAKSWAEKYGVNGQKKRFNDYTQQELWQLIRNAEKMKEDHIKSVTRRL